MPFINGIWNEPEKEIINSIKLTNSNITLTYLYSKEYNGTYRLVYSIIIFSGKYDLNDPTLIRKIDNNSLKDAILNSIQPYDKSYMKLVNYSFKIVTFDFMWQKWIKEATNGIQPRTYLSKFAKSISLKKQIPKMISYGYGREYFSDFLEKKFKEYVSNRRFNLWFSGLIPEQLTKKYSNNLSNMFDFEYDMQTNNILLRLKNIYIFALLFATDQTINNSQQPYVKIDFSKKVKDKIIPYDKNKWETFIKRKFI